jgi:hypothetical protein
MRTCLLTALSVLGALACAANIAQAQAGDPVVLTRESSVTAYGGYRMGGQLTDTATDRDVDVKSHASYALAVDIGLDPQSQIQLFYSHQKTALSSGLFTPTANDFPLTIEYFHIGGTYFIHGVGYGGYMVGGLGATRLKPADSSLGSDTKFSANLGFGYMLPIGRHLGLRFEVRGYATLLENNSSLFCSNGTCVVTVKGNALYQGEALVGLSVRF